MLTNHLILKFSNTTFRLVHCHSISYFKCRTAGRTTASSAGRTTASSAGTRSWREHHAGREVSRWGSPWCQGARKAPVPLGPRSGFSGVRAASTRLDNKEANGTAWWIVHSFHYSQSFQVSGWMNLATYPIRQNTRTRQKTTCPSVVLPSTPQRAWLRMPLWGST